MATSSDPVIRRLAELGVTGMVLPLNPFDYTRVPHRFLLKLSPPVSAHLRLLGRPARADGGRQPIQQCLSMKATSFLRPS